MEKIIYYCDCCGKEVEYKNIKYYNVYYKNKFDCYSYSAEPSNTYDICLDCEKKIKKFMEDLKK